LQEVKIYGSEAVSRTRTMDSVSGIGYTHFYCTWNTLWNVEWSSRILEVASCFLWKNICRNIQNDFKEQVLYLNGTI